MTLSLAISPSKLADAVPPSSEVAEAAARGVCVLVRNHFRARNASRPPNRWGLPKSNYWALAAEATQVKRNVVTVSKEGVAVHLFGGIIRPKEGRRALALPIDPRVADVNPRETGMKLDVIWRKGNKTGFLKDPETGDLLWMLIPQAKIRADRSVLPDDDALFAAASDAVLDHLEATA